MQCRIRDFNKTKLIDEMVIDKTIVWNLNLALPTPYSPIQR